MDGVDIDSHVYCKRLEAHGPGRGHQPIALGSASTLPDPRFRSVEVTRDHDRITVTESAVCFAGSLAFAIEQELHECRDVVCAE
jgi:hypothetical protein